MPVPDTEELPRFTAESEYFRWSSSETELRAFLLATSRGMQSWFAEREEAANDAAGRFDPDSSYGDEAYNEFMDDVGIFWDQYWERIAAMVIKEAFKAFEVFLEASAHSILRRNGSGLVDFDSDSSWNFNDCTYFYQAYIGLEVLPSRIAAIKWIRDKLSHLEELRTPQGEQILASRTAELGLNSEPSDAERALGLHHDDWTSMFERQLTFTPLQTWRLLQLLRGHVNNIAKGLILFRTRTNQQLLDLSNGTAINPRSNAKKKGDTRFLIVPEISS